MNTLTGLVLIAAMLCLGPTARAASDIHDRHDEGHAHPAADDHARAFPHFALIRGGGLDSAVLLYHANVTFIDGVADLRESPLAIVYSSLNWVTQPDSGMLAQQRYYEVAEFYGPRYMYWYGESGKPDRPLRFRDANHFSRIYPDAPGGAVWDRPSSQPRNSSAPFVGIPEEAAHVLRSLGLDLTPVPPAR
jgi:hypothetical protein